MALADYVLSYELPFKDIDGNQWRVRIYDRDAVAPVTPERLKGTGSPVQITYDGDEDFTQGIIGSSCVISVYGTPNQDGTSDLSQFFVADEERFYVLVEWTNDNLTYNTYWKGFLHQDEYREHITSDPYMVELVAFDRLGTIKTRLDEVGYNADSTTTLQTILGNLNTETKLEFTLADGSGLSRLGGNNVSFLGDQKINMETFMEAKGEFVRMIPITDCLSQMAVATGCRIFQSNGQLVFKSLKSTTADLTASKPIGSNLRSIGDNLYARHRPAKRTTNMSIKVGALNIFDNGSFERDPDGDTTPISWSQSATNSGTFEVSSELSYEGSLQSLKTTNNRLSDLDFNNLSIADKKGIGTLVKTTTADIGLSLTNQLTGILKFRFFINNTDNEEPYELRFSLERSNGVTEHHYDFQLKKWWINNNTFYYAFADFESTGEWQTVEIPFTLFGSDFYDVGNPQSVDPIIFRIHTMNYKDDLSLLDVEVFYDNFEMRLYNSGKAEASLLPETEYYNVSTDDNVETKTGSVDIEVNQGVSSFEIYTLDTLTPDNVSLLERKILGQYFNGNTLDIDTFDFDVTDPLTADYRPLSSLIMSIRKEFDAVSNRVYEGTLATSTSVTPWTPITFDDVLTLDYSAFTDTTPKRFIRFDFDVKGNRYDIEAINVP